MALHAALYFRTPLQKTLTTGLINSWCYLLPQSCTTSEDCGSASVCLGVYVHPSLLDYPFDIRNTNTCGKCANWPVMLQTSHQLLLHSCTEGIDIIWSHTLELRHNLLSTLLWQFAECPSGSYGQDCLEQCQCQSGSSCDFIMCNCTMSWTGVFSTRSK